MTEHQAAMQQLAQDYEQKLSAKSAVEHELRLKITELNNECEKLVQDYLNIKKAMRYLLKSI